MSALIASEAATSGFGFQNRQTHAETWGFDMFDLEWETTLTDFDSSPLHILRFREAFDLPPVTARFDERDFTTEELDGATLRTHSPDLSQDWVADSELAMLNTAFLADGRTLVASSDEDGVRRVVAELADTGAKPGPLLDTAASLSGASAAVLLSGTATCDQFVPGPLPGVSPEAIEQLREDLDQAGPLSAYGALGVGYSRTWEPIGRIVFAYPEGEVAEDELEARRSLAQDALSLQANEPYSEVVLTVDDAAAVGSTLALQVTPAGDMPRRLFGALFARDMLFAACTE